MFEIQHAKLGVSKGDGLGNGDNVDHPNRYFDASRALYKEKAGKENNDEAVKKEAVNGKVKKEDAMDVDK